MNHSKSKLRVLVIDDDLEVLDTYEDILDVHNIECIKCADGISGLELLATDEFDLIILDNNMPEIDGTEVSRLARFTLAKNSVPIIMISGINNNLNTLECMTLGLNGFLKKPITPTMLIDTIKRAIKQFKEDGQCVWV